MLTKVFTGLSTTIVIITALVAGGCSSDKMHDDGKMMKDDGMMKDDKMMDKDSMMKDDKTMDDEKMMKDSM